MRNKHLFGIIVIAMWYLLTMPTLVPLSGDAMQEVDLATGHEPLRSNHLLLSPTFHAGIVVFNIADIHNPIIAAQLVNIFFGIVGLVFLYAIARIFFSREQDRWWVTALYALSFVVWRHTVESESAIIANTMLLTSVYFLVRSEKLDGLSVTLSGFFFGASMLYALNIITLVPAWLFYSWKRARKNNLSPVLLLVPGWSVLTLYGTFIVQQNKGAVFGFIKWITSHGNEASLSGLRSSGIEIPLRMMTGLINAFQPFSEVTPALRLMLKGNSVVFSEVSLGSWLIFLAAVALAIWLIVKVLQWFWRSEKEDRILFLVAVIPTFFFFALWLSSDPQFWLPVIPCIVLLAARRGVTRYEVFVSMALLVIIDIAAMPAPCVLHNNAGEEFRREREIHRALPRESILFSMSVPYVVHAVAPDRTVNFYFPFDVSTPFSSLHHDTVLTEHDIARYVLESHHEIVFDELLSPRLLHAGQWSTWQLLSGSSRERLIRRLLELPGCVPDTVILDTKPQLRLTKKNVATN